MSFVQGKNSKVTINSKDLSTYSNKVQFKQKGETQDVTTFGKNSKVYAGTLKDGTCSIDGIYDSSATNGPAGVLRPLLATSTTLIYQPEGVGTGKPTHTVGVVVSSYEESSPVADMVSWTCELQLSDDIASTVQ